MLEPNHELGIASSVKPNAVGVPGQRQFRLLVEAQGGSACLWLEKEQLLQLGITVKQLIAQIPEVTRPAKEEPDLPTSDSHLQERSWDFKVSALTLGHDSHRNLFMVAVQDMEANDGGPPLLRFWADGRQMNTLAEEAFEVCAAGRPLCPLCGTPMNPGESHACLRRNGHNPSGEWA